VLALLARGRPNKSIADELGIGVRTVKGQVSVILRALHADNRVDAARGARKWLARATPRS
jgi:DNA-binding NarL/FixJ family response regulator